MHVHGEIDPWLVHRSAHQEHLRTLFHRRLMPFAVEVDADRIGPQMAATAAVRIHVGHDVKVGLPPRQPRHAVLSFANPPRPPPLPPSALASARFWPANTEGPHS